MKLFLDACVLYPVATREILLGYARAGGFAPLWSARVLAEWARAAAAKLGPEDEARARGDAALMSAWFHGGMVEGYEAREAEVWSPDAADAHVIAAAVEGGAEGIVTFNTRDFPLKELRRLGLERLHPDGFLAARLRGGDEALATTMEPLAKIAAARGATMRKFLKRAALPRLGKAWEARDTGLE